MKITTLATIIMSSIAAFCSNTLFANWNMFDATVKVRSGLCHSNDLDYRGSGVLLRDGERVLVLTSEHVLLHGNEDICHSVSNATIGLKHAKLIAAEWSLGLALLELPGFSTELDLPSSKHILSTSVLQNDLTQILGFPYDHDQPFHDTQGMVATPKSHRHFLPQSGDVIEIIHSHGEFGMSGGPVFNAAGDAIIGILSHQFLQIGAAGQRPTVGEYSDHRTSSSNHLLLIPGSSARQWVTKTLQAAQPASFFLKDAQEQIAGQDVVHTSGLSFEALPSEDDACAASDADGSGGVGGDVIGVVGSGSSKRGAIQISITRDRNAASRGNTTWYLQDHPAKAKWLEQLESRLLRPSTVLVPALVQRQADDQIKRVCVYSLQEFFRKLTSDGVEAMTLVDSPSTGHETNQVLQSVRQHSRELMDTLRVLENAEGKHWSRTTRIFFKRLKVLNDLVQSDSWMLLKREDFSTLAETSGRYRLAWQDLFSSSYFQETSNMLNRLNRLAEEIERIRF